MANLSDPPRNLSDPPRCLRSTVTPTHASAVRQYARSSRLAVRVHIARTVSLVLDLVNSAIGEPVEMSDRFRHLTAVRCSARGSSGIRRLATAGYDPKETKVPGSTICRVVASGVIGEGVLSPRAGREDLSGARA